MQGSEKQLKWAADIQAGIQESLIWGQTAVNEDGDPIFATPEGFTILNKRFKALVKAKQEAAWWIENFQFCSFESEIEKQHSVSRFHRVSNKIKWSR